MVELVLCVKEAERLEPILPMPASTESPKAASRRLGIQVVVALASECLSLRRIRDRVVVDPGIVMDHVAGAELHEQPVLDVRIRTTS